MLTEPQSRMQSRTCWSGPGGSYIASDMRVAYYGGTTLDGNGQSVGLLEFTGYDLSDAAARSANAGQTYNVGASIT